MTATRLVTTPAPARCHVTRAHYAAHADRYVARTASLDCSPLYRSFLDRLPDRARILDAGCGSGRDAAAFQTMGHAVAAFDWTPALATAAAARLGHPVPCLAFDEVPRMPWRGVFDGVWASHSLIHVPKAHLPWTLGQLADTLTVSGTLYASFIWGERDQVEHGRHFSDFTTTSLEALLAQVPSLSTIAMWRTPGLGPHTPATNLNVLCVRRIPYVWARP